MVWPMRSHGGSPHYGVADHSEGGRVTKTGRSPGAIVVPDTPERPLGASWNFLAAADDSKYLSRIDRLSIPEELKWIEPFVEKSRRVFSSLL